MIIAEPKPFSEIYEMLKGKNKVLVLGCGTCVTVCMAGGEKETGILGSSIRLANQQNKVSMEIEEATIS